MLSLSFFCVCFILICFGLLRLCFAISNPFVVLAFWFLFWWIAPFKTRTIFIVRIKKLGVCVCVEQNKLQLQNYSNWFFFSSRIINKCTFPRLPYALAALKFTPKSKFMAHMVSSRSESVPSAESEKKRDKVEIRFGENQRLIDFYMLIWFRSANRSHFSWCL